MDKVFVTIKIGANRYRKVFVDDIFYCEADGAYSRIRTVDSEYILCKSLKHLDFLFKNYSCFLRVNRSFIVNLNKCIEIKIGTKPKLIVENGEIIVPKQCLLKQILISFNIENNDL